MEYKNKLSFKTFKQFYSWLKINHDKEKECWLLVNRSKPNKSVISYIDAVYGALCFGWIDSVFKKIDNKTYQRFSKRSNKSSNWTELNKQRCRWLIKHKYMTKSGLEVIPDLDKEYVFDKDVIKQLKKDKKVWENFNKFPDLYKRIRVSWIVYYKKDKIAYKKALSTLIKNTKLNKMYGSWNDNGRLK